MEEYKSPKLRLKKRKRPMVKVKGKESDLDDMVVTPKEKKLPYSKLIRIKKKGSGGQYKGVSGPEFKGKGKFDRSKMSEKEIDYDTYKYRKLFEKKKVGPARERKQRR